jgi:cell division protein FtsI (penicillin-binding protein 3)
MTPLRMLTLYNAVAHNGKMMKPFLIETIREYNKIIKQNEPVVLNEQIASPQTIAYLKEILEAVVIEGTAKNLYNTFYSVAGKTGTAQIADNSNGYAHKIYQASFMGYFPANNPLYSIAVVINNPRGGVIYGSAVAAPVFKEIADNVYASQIDMHPKPLAEAKTKLLTLCSGMKQDIEQLYQSFGIPIINSSTGNWVVPVICDSTLSIKQVDSYDGKVPNVVGMGLRDALYILESRGIQVKLNGYGFVKSQSIKAGTSVSKDQTILLTLGL